jgi:guanylate kinase
VKSCDAGGHGSLIVIAAPSGAGKTTLVRALIERMPELRFSVSFTTRKPRVAEVDGVDYRFVSDDEFRRMINAGEFLEYARVFDHWYGTGKASVESLRAQGFTVLLEIDWQGARQVRSRAPDARTIFIVPPSIPDLELRLRGRKTDSDAVIARRLGDSVSDLRHWTEFDYIIVNDDIEVAADELTAIVAGDGAGSSSQRPEVRARVEAILAGSG